MSLLLFTLVLPLKQHTRALGCGFLYEIPELYYCISLEGSIAINKSLIVIENLSVDVNVNQG